MFAGPYPMLRPVAAFIAGIATALLWSFSAGAAAAALALVLTALVWWLSLRSLQRSFPLRWVPGLLLLVAFFLLGGLWTRMADETQRPDHFLRSPEAVAWSVDVRSRPVEKERSIRFTGEAVAVQRPGGRWKACSGKMMVYLSKDDAARAIRYGDRLFFRQRPRPVPGPRNPGGFDYGGYLAGRGIHRQVFLPSAAWHGVARHERSIMTLALQWRERLVRILGAEIPDPAEYSVAAALVLGHEDEVEPELAHAYAGAGVIHVLAVSGLHVGILFLAISALLGWMNRWRWTRHARYVLLLAVTWWYAMLTGFSPSVLRASAMLSFVVVGLWSGRDAEVGNALVASAFVLLLVDPLLITRTGFQLSYLAVFGICYIHPLIFRLWEPANGLLHRTWELTSVSASAQLMTFPLAAMAFHQFPNLFLLSNLAVIPLATVAIYCGMTTLLLAALGNTLKLVVAGCSGMVWGMNRVVRTVDSIPGSVTTGIELTAGETLLVYAVILSAAGFAFRHRAQWLFAALAALVLFSACRLGEAWRTKGRHRTVVYDVPGHAAMDFIQGHAHRFIADSALTAESASLEKYIERSWRSQRLAVITDTLPGLSEWKGHILFGGRRMLRLNRTLRAGPAVRRLQLDVLVLTGNVFQQAAGLARYFDVRQVVIDASYPRWRAAYIRDGCAAKGIACHSVPHAGAWVMDW